MGRRWNSGGMRKKLRLIPVDSTKNIIQSNLTHFGVVAGTLTQSVIADCVDSAGLAVQEQVESGCNIYSLEIHYRITSSGTLTPPLGPINMCIYKKPSGYPAMTAAQIQSLGTDDIKRFVLHMDKLHSETASQVMEWHIRLKLPKGIKRFITGDQLILATHCLAGATDQCGFAVYKWYR